MEQVHTVTQLLEHIHRGRAALDAVVAHIDDDTLSAPGAMGEWSGKDLLAHLAFWERRMVTSLRCAQRGEDPYPGGSVESDEEVDRLNAEAYEACREMPVGEVRSLVREAHIEAIAAVRSLSDADLDKSSAISRLLRAPARKLIEDNTFGHYEEHIAALQGLGRPG